jgi:hypothetical protein
MVGMDADCVGMVFCIARLLTALCMHVIYRSRLGCQITAQKEFEGMKVSKVCVCSMTGSSEGQREHASDAILTV